MTELRKDHNAARQRGGDAARKQAQHQPSADFDWDRAIAGLYRILAELRNK